LDQSWNAEQSASRRGSTQALRRASRQWLGRNDASSQTAGRTGKKDQRDNRGLRRCRESQERIYPKTVEGYAVALRKIAADIHGLADTPEKKSPIHREAWRGKVSSIKLRTLTTEKIENWRADFIKRKGINPVKEKSARVSANSFIRRARSLFGHEVVARVRDTVELPEPIPFSGVKVEKVRVSRYRSSFDMATLL
jgi:hypothetical protein